MQNLVWRGRPLTQKAREKGSGDRPIPEWYHSPGILGLLMECGLFTSCSIKAAIAIMAFHLSSLVPAAFRWNKADHQTPSPGKGSVTPDYAKFN